MGRTEFTPKEDSFLVQYIAKYCSETRGRSGNSLYQTLVANENNQRWPWAATHSWNAWRERYVKNKDDFDRRIRKHQAKMTTKAGGHSTSVPHPSSAPKSEAGRPQPFTRQEDLLLVQYLAVETCDGLGRMGNAVYEKLVEKHDWTYRHPWQSWRERYKKRRELFDEMISNYQKRYQISTQSFPDSTLLQTLRPIEPRDVEPLESASERASTPEASQASVVSERAVQAQRLLETAARHRKAPTKHLRGGEADPGGRSNAADARKDGNKRVAADSDEEEVDRKRRRVEKVPAAEEALHEPSFDASTPAAVPRTAVPAHVTPTRPTTNSAYPTQLPATTGSLPVYDGETLDEVEQATPIPQHLRGTGDGPSTQTAFVDVPRSQYLQKEHSAAPPSNTAFVDVPRSQYLQKEHSAAPPSNTAPSPTKLTSQYMKSMQELTPPTSDAAMSPQRTAPATSRTTLVEISEPPMSHRSTIDYPDRARTSQVDDPNSFDAFMPAAQSSLPRPRPSNQPPMRVEGAFNSAITGRAGRTNMFKKVRRVGGLEFADSESDGEPSQPPGSWPTKRGRNRDATQGSSHGQPSTHTASQRASEIKTERPTGAGQKRTLSGVLPTARPVQQPRAAMPPPRDIPKPVKVATASWEDPESPRQSTVVHRAATRQRFEMDQPEAGPSTRVHPDPPMERRHTLGTPAAHISPARRALRPRHSMPALTELNRPRARDANIVSNMSFGGRLLTDDDHKLSVELGMQQILQQLAQASGFSYEVVENIWKACGTVADTEVMLERIRASAEEEADNAYHALGIEEKVQERERPFVVDELDPDDRAADMWSEDDNLPYRYADETAEYFPPDNSKAAFFIRSMREREEAEALDAATELESASDEGSEAEDEEDDDPKLIQAQRILARVKWRRE
ncbi:hypothetical protein BDW22DRAFT_980452 [Trametopsis cervina]|nr:hypothetical protein BDW22DRAFT_980452 [Trametopsis cervina]